MDNGTIIRNFCIRSGALCPIRQVEFVASLANEYKDVTKMNAFSIVHDTWGGARVEDGGCTM
jgi:hypothetical protein